MTVPPLLSTLLQRRGTSAPRCRRRKRATCATIDPPLARSLSGHSHGFWKRAYTATRAARTIQHPIHENCCITRVTTLYSALSLSHGSVAYTARCIQLRYTGYSLYTIQPYTPPLCEGSPGHHYAVTSRGEINDSYTRSTRAHRSQSTVASQAARTALLKSTPPHQARLIS